MHSSSTVVGKVGQLAGAWLRNTRGVCVPVLQCSARGVVTALERDPYYNTVNESDLTFFRGLLGSDGVITDPGKLSTYNRDWLRKYTGHSTVALRPRSTEHVSHILAHCSLRRLAVVPQGGNTGLVGGSVPVFDEVVLSLSEMNEIESFDEASGVVMCQAGCVLEALDNYVARRGFLVPLDLGAKGSCHIGGNVATNAGGLRVLRYGPLSGSVLGLEVVAADGCVLDLQRALVKDNTGLPLRQLFIGSEGALGIITHVAIQCRPRPSSVQLALVACDTFTDVLRVMRTARVRLGEALSVLDFMDATSVEMAVEYCEGVRNPISTPAKFFVIVEASGSSSRHTNEKMEDFLECAYADGCSVDGTLCASGPQEAAVWRLREAVPESLVRRGAVYKYDLSLPTPHMYELVNIMRERLAHLPSVRVVGFGHAGDGNLHLNVSSLEWSEELRELIEPFVYEWTAAHGGSISAEHGVGLMKAEQLPYSKPAVAIEYMGQLKRMFDPHRILNPYKLLPRDTWERAYADV